METAIKARGETAFKEAGDGVILRFRNSDLKRLEADLGPGWFQDMMDSFLKGRPSWAYIDKMLEHGVKKDGAPYVIPEEVLDEIPVHVVGDLLMDAACISMKGMTAKETIKEMMDAIADAQAMGEDPSPASPDTTSSTNSEEAASGPESA